MGTLYPAVIPMIAYEDGPAAIEWLAKAFGFRERPEMRYTNEDGTLGHAEMETGRGGLIMLATPTPDYESPRRHRQHCAEAAKWSEVPYIVDGYLVHVDDVEAHYSRAKGAGARILREPEKTENGHLYNVEDLEGHRWMFSQG